MARRAETVATRTLPRVHPAVPGSCSPNYLPLHINHLSRREVVSERLEVLERPHHLLVPGHLDELRVIRPGVAVADDDVAVRQDVQGRYPGERDAGQLLLVDAP